MSKNKNIIQVFEHHTLKVDEESRFKMVHFKALDKYGYKTKLWGVPLPHWGWKSPVLNEIFTDIHVASSVALLSLIILHLCGVIFHLYTGEMNIFRRMIPAWK